MQSKIGPKCPICSGNMTVQAIHCEECGITITGNMKMQEQTGVFKSDEWEFIREFIICEGNLKCLGEKLGKSYPTIKNKLQEIKDNLPGYEHNVEYVDNILDSIETGDIDIQKALNKLKRRK